MKAPVNLDYTGWLGSWDAVGETATVAWVHLQ